MLLVDKNGTTCLVSLVIEYLDLKRRGIPPKLNDTANLVEASLFHKHPARYYSQKGLLSRYGIRR